MGISHEPAPRRARGNSECPLYRSDVTFGAVLGYVVGTSVARDRKGELPELFGMKLVSYADPTTGASGLALLKSW